jgi:hypothetical protein
MARNFIKTVKTDGVFASVTTTANSTLFSDYVDLANYEGCMLTAIFKSTAASTGTCTFTVVGADSTSTAKASATAVNGASVSVAHSTTLNGKRVAAIDVYRPQYRYVAAKLAKQAGLICNGIIAQRYGTRYQPAPASTTYAAATAAASFDLVVEGT